MDNRRLPGGNPRRLAVLFLAVVAPPAVALMWLGWQLLQNDKSLGAQRDVERRQAAALPAVRSLEQSLTAAERFNGDAQEDGMVRFTVSSIGVRAQPANRILWVPVPPAMPSAATAPFAAAERIEFREAGDSAVRIYLEMARAPEPRVRAGALLRLARIHRRSSRWDDALAAYRLLISANTMAIDGTPADLVARRAICSILEEAGRRDELRQEATALQSDLLAGRWQLDQPAWEFTAYQIEQWTGRVVPIPTGRKEFSEVAGWLWKEWNRNPAERLPTVSRRFVLGRHTLLWRTEESQAVIVAIAPPLLRMWAEKAMRSAGTTDPLSLLAATGEPLVGPAPAVKPAVVRSPATETGLPWTLALSPGNSSQQQQEFAVRRRLLSLGLAAIILLLAGSSYVLWRVIQRELAIARLQTEFVSTVSHEFRTPLTSLRHVTELLEEDDDMPRDRRRSFYAALSRNTERLHRLVESLLDFARMEGGRKPYDLRPVDATELTAQVVSDFRKEVEPRGFTVELEAEPSALPLRADAPSLTNALWNLLDNAVKYSPERDSVRVSVRRHRSGVAISVQDHGLGIPRREQSEIFRRFVRGEQASRLGIKGTGLGLAMVSHIVQAHGGAIELESEEGSGSTFRLVFPECS